MYRMHPSSITTTRCETAVGWSSRRVPACISGTPIISEYVGLPVAAALPEERVSGGVGRLG